MSEQLSWPIEKIVPQSDDPDDFLVIFEHGGGMFLRRDDLVAAGIPAEPYPPSPVVITVTRGDQTRTVPLSDEAADGWSIMLDPCDYETPGARARAEVGVALRELGVRRD